MTAQAPHALLPLENYDHILISFSGGKDSLACLLHLLELGLPQLRDNQGLRASVAQELAKVQVKAKTMKLIVSPQGNVRCVYSEELDLRSLGRVSITRGSHVEPDGNGYWFVDLSPAAGPRLGPSLAAARHSQPSGSG